VTDDPRRARGREMMRRVYGWEVGDVEGDFVSLTVDHLFGEIWARDGLTVRERRLLLLGLLVGSGLDDVVGLQLDAALHLEELSPDELREIVVFLTHYAGWPRGAKLNTQVEELLAQRDERS
jgi:4-carboxymuconolactone decarboxylase